LLGGSRDRRSLRIAQRRSRLLRQGFGQQSGRFADRLEGGPGLGRLLDPLLDCRSLGFVEFAEGVGGQPWIV